MKLAIHHQLVSEYKELYLWSPHTFLWCGGLLKPESNFTFTSKRQCIKQVHIILSINSRKHRSPLEAHSSNVSK